jgi:3-hydroxyacyl-CoA dehydrogenase
MSAEVVKVAYEGGVAVITANHPPVNAIGAAVRQGLFAAVAEIAARDDIQAAILICEGSTFFSGADIGEFSGPPKEEEFRRLFNSIEQLNVPVVAAMHGTVLGGGLEIALACHYRIAAPGTRFGLPEVTLGIIPGAGGTQRMPRLIGVEKTIELVLGARPVDTAKALELGFLDQVVDGALRIRAVAFARELVAAAKGPRRTGEMKVDPASAGESVIARAAEAARRQYPNRQAPLTAIDAIAAAARLPLDQGLEYETELANRCKATTEARALIHVFFAERETRKIPGIAAEPKKPAAKQAAIVGAGTMGRGIAICFANAGIPVTVLDASRDALERGLADVDSTYESMVKRGRLSAEDKARRRALITGALDYASVKDADVIIEAVFENLELKKRIFAELDRVAKPGALLATNTSTLDIDAIAAAVTRPQDVIGLHFFSPANVMPLLEVVRASRTSPEAIRASMDLARPLKKVPVLARVCYGFIGNRMMEGYAREAERMLLEGATPRRVDTVLEHWGMAMGILAVFDMAGIEVGVSVHKENAHRYPADPTYYQADAAIYDAGRLGRKNGRGYYRYEGRERIDDPEVLELLRARARKLGVAPRAHDDQEILERCLYPMLNEGLRILQEGVAVRASDIDVVWTSGYGFPRYRGGPMFHADIIGLAGLLEGMHKYRRIFGPMHWEPAPLLEQLVKEGKSLADWEREREPR